MCIGDVIDFKVCSLCHWLLTTTTETTLVYQSLPGRKKAQIKTTAFTDLIIRCDQYITTYYNWLRMVFINIYFITRSYKTHVEIVRHYWPKAYNK